MKVRQLMVLTMLALLVALIPAASAQDTMCFNLSAADCEVLTSAQANSANITSSTINLTLDLSVTGLGQFDPTTQDVTVTASGSGMWAFDMAQVDDPMNGVSAAMDLQLAASGTGSDESLAFKFVVKDGVVYVQDPDSQQWLGFSIDDAMSMAGMPFSPEMFMNPEAMAGMGGMGDLSAFGDIANIPGFITMERLADTTVAGVNVIPFATNIDFIPLLTSPEFGDILGMAMAAAGGAGGATTPGMDGAQLAALVPMLLGESTATMNLTQWVGSDDNFLHGISLDIDASIDPSGIMMMAGGAAGAAAPTSMEPIVVDFSLVVELGDINGTFDIQAPEGAVMTNP